MSRRTLHRAASAAVLIVLGLMSTTQAGEPVRLKMTEGTLPKPAAIAFASGSGLVIAKRYVLTNRHIAQDEKGKLFDGFRIYLGPDYKKGVPAKAIAVCENYDLALLETSSDLPAVPMTVLDGLPALSERVIAYGFPLGSRFGISLTTTGGQVARHPVAASRGDDKEDISVKTALWHDAALTGGNSGGPLFTASKLLVGVNFAYLKTNSNQALAVPSDVVADFLRHAKADKEVKMVKPSDASSGSGDPLAMTAFIESMVSDVSGREVNLEDANSLTEMLVSKLKLRLPQVTAADLKRVEAGELQRAFPPVRVAALEAGEIFRLRGDMTVLAIRDEGMVTMVDDVICLVLLPEGEADEVRIRLAKTPNPKFPVDQVYFVGPPAPIRFSEGTRFALVLLPLKKLTESTDFKNVLEEEKARRDTKKVTEGDPEQQKTIARYEAMLRHKFTDASGRFQVDAVAVKIGSQNVDLVRLPEKQRLSVSVERLSPEDRVWLRNNEKWVSLYGKKLEDFYVPATAAADKGK